MSLEQRYRILHTDAETEVSTDITEALSIGEDEGIETQIDTFTFDILVPSTGTGTLPVFEVNDLVAIYFDDGSATPTTLIMDGYITELNYAINPDQFVVKINRSNRLERVLNSPRPGQYNLVFAYVGEEDSVSRNGVAGVITNYIDLANENKREGEINITYDTTSIKTTKSNGSTWGDMPKSYYSNWKSIFEHIETLSDNEWTEDGNYLYWLDTDNKFY